MNLTTNLLTNFASKISVAAAIGFSAIGLLSQVQANNIWDQPVTQSNLQVRPQMQMAKLQPVSRGSIWAQPATTSPQAARSPMALKPAPIPSATALRPTLKPAPTPLAATTRPMIAPRPAPVPPAAAGTRPPLPKGYTASARDLIRACDSLGKEPLVYKFGSNDPSTGSLDCSGTIQTVLKRIGYKSVPRTSYMQYDWLQEHGLLKKVRRGTPASKILSDLRPGQLIFWKGTYKSDKPVTHVMVYLGKSKDGNHYMFGARGTKKKGLNGNGVDVFVFDLNDNKSKTPIVGYGDIPQLAYVY